MKAKKVSVLVLLAIAAVAAATGPLGAQTYQGTLRGSIRDALAFKALTPKNMIPVAAIAETVETSHGPTRDGLFCCDLARLSIISKFRRSQATRQFNWLSNCPRCNSLFRFEIVHSLRQSFCV